MFLIDPVDKQCSLIPVPAKRQVFYDLWEAQTATFWTINAIGESLSMNKQDWAKATPQIKALVRGILLLFGPIDKYAMSFSGQAISGQINSVWVTSMLAAFAFMETIHNQVYGRLADVLFLNNPGDRVKAEEEAEAMPEIKAILDWASRRSESASLETLLLGAMGVEGIILQTLFNPIYALKAKSLFNGLTAANELIARDENLHVNGYIAIFKTCERPDQSVAMAIFDEAVQLVSNLIRVILPAPIPAVVSPDEVIEFSKVVANKIAEACGYGKFYNASRIPAYMTMQNMPQFTSFHAIRPTTYIQPTTSGSWRAALD